MNVATRLKIEQMEKDIKELKEQVSTLVAAQSISCETGQQHMDDVEHVVPAALAGKTLTLPEKRKSA